MYVSLSSSRVTLVVFICSFIMAGCAISKGTINTFYEPSYKVGSVESLALPSIRNARLAPAESQQIGRTVNQAIAKENPDIKMISANTFNNLLNDNGWVDDYSNFIEDYITSGVANSEFLMNLSSNGIDAILLSELSSVSLQDGVYGQHGAEARVTMSFTIINTKNNDVIWTASADGIKGTATILEPAPPLIEAINLAVDKVRSSIPKL